MVDQFIVDLLLRPDQPLEMQNLFSEDPVRIHYLAIRFL